MTAIVGSGSPVVPAGEAHKGVNPFVVILGMLARDLGTQNAGINGGLDAEVVAKGRFEQAQEGVEAARRELAKVLADTKATEGQVSAAIVKLQAAQAVAGAAQNKMVELFKEQVDPSWGMVQADLAEGGFIIRENRLSGAAKSV